MMTCNFRPGTLTASDAETLNEFVRKVSALLRLSVAPPLSMTRNNGIPSGLTIALPPGVALARITGNDAATPPVYQATIETRDDANAVEDTYPVSTIENLLSPVGDTFATDELVYAVPIADQPGWYWGFPASGYTPPATNTATSVAGGWLAGLLSTSCLSLTVLGGSGACSGVDTTQVLTLVYDTGTWASTTDFTYDTGAGPVVLSITADGLPKLTIDGIAGVGDGGGIDSNGDCFFDFAFGGTTLCDGTATACCGNIFRVRLKCTECPIATECCPARLLPRTLYVTFSGATGDCTCMEGVTLTLSWLSGSSWATADGVSTPIPGCPTANNVYYTFTCASSLAGWQFATSGYTGPPTSYSITFASSGYSRTQACDGSTPLLVTWTAVPVSGNCTGTINITITETHP